MAKKQNLDEIKRQLKEIEQLYEKLQLTNPFAGINAKTIANSANEVKRLTEELQDARDAVSDMEGEAGDLFKSWRAITNEVKGHRRVLNDSKSTVSQINDLSQKLKDHQNKINSLSSKELNNLKSKLEQQKSVLKSNQASLENTISELESKSRLNTTEQSQLREARILHQNIEGSLEKQSGVLDSIINKTQEELEKRKAIETKLGVTGGILKGISKIPVLGNLIDTDKTLKAANDEIENSKSGLKGLSAGFKEMGSQIKNGFLNPSNLAVGFITQMLLALKSTDKAAGDMAKSMNLTYSDALGVRKEFGSIAAMSGDTAVNTRGLQETYIAIGKSLGSNAKLNEKDLITATKLREQAGYTNDQLVELNKLTAVNGKSIEQNTQEILGGAKAYASRRGLVINEKDVLNDVVNASSSLKLSLGGSADALAKAAVQTRAVGLNLEQAAAMANSLLQFESSIENELSAELLLGKDLNFEKARQLALNNDIAGAAEEIAKQVGTSADFANMNAIQQEAIAKAAGLTKDQLAQSLMDREALAKLSGVEGKDAKEKFDNLVKQVGMEEAKKRLGSEQLANQFAQQSVQERFTQSIEKLQEIFVNLAEPVLAIVSPFVDLLLPAISTISGILSSMSGIIGNIVAGVTVWYTTTKLIAGLNSTIAFLKGLSAAADKNGVSVGRQMISQLGIMVGLSTTKAVAETTAATALSFGTLLPIILGAGAAIYGLISSFKGNDIMSPGDGSSGYGKRTLFGPEGAIQLNNKDTVIAGTDLFKKSDDMVSSPKGSITVANSTAPKKETPIDVNAGTNARLDALIAMTGKVNSISTLKIQ